LDQADSTIDEDAGTQLEDDRGIVVNPDGSIKPLTAEEFESY